MDARIILQPRRAITSHSAEALINFGALFDAVVEAGLIEADGDGAAVLPVALQLELLAVFARPSGLMELPMGRSEEVVLLLLITGMAEETEVGRGEGMVLGVAKGADLEDDASPPPRGPEPVPVE
ncbi:MAG: hypothetical protein Q9223_005512 [Gallowayella weberi]